MKYLILPFYYLYQVCFLLPFTVVSTAFFGLLATIMCPIADGTWWGNFCGHWWGRSIVWATLLPVRVEGREYIAKDKSYILVANHQGCYDIFLVFGFINRPIRWMMKASLKKVPFIGSSCTQSGQVFIDHSGPSKIKHSYDQARDILRRGGSLMVFPEGRRTYTGKMGQFRRGAFLLADELQLPVVPMTITGSFEVMSRKRDFHFAHWHPLTLKIHEPIYPVGQGDDNVKHLMETSWQTINSALE